MFFVEFSKGKLKEIITADEHRLTQMKEDFISVYLRSKIFNLLLIILVKKSVWIIGGDGWAYNIEENPLQLDSRTPKILIENSMYMENRFKMLTKINSETAKELLKEAQFDVNTR